MILFSVFNLNGTGNWMQIQPQYLSLSDLLEHRLFRIPEYQRAYSWQSKQREDLFEDIKKVFKSNGDAVHFMATIVGLRRKKRTIASDVFYEVEVVDGQQRLTTLAILLKAISKGKTTVARLLRQAGDAVPQTMPQRAPQLLESTPADQAA